ncbi:hypothetical protein AGMMS49545_02160 [Betaproteobacteria bacterium]|nr:hypothetical protein AGMMS49545_02160 [Betaproteobacteria bacterium]GHU43830.1 hypothetical protein AGMMS50289_10950 [Betaproteobacteria bacterium]
MTENGSANTVGLVAEARYYKTSARRLTKLAQHESAEVRTAVAMNDHTPAALKRLAGDKKASVRGWVAENSNTPQESLVILARDKDADVRMEVAGNYMQPRETVEILDNDKNAQVRSRLLYFHQGSSDACSVERLLEMAGSDSAAERCSALRHLTCR